jgi:primosomal protein N'
MAVGDVDGMRWTEVGWALVCPTDDVPLTGYSAAGDLVCPMCGVTDREVAASLIVGRPRCPFCRTVLAEQADPAVLLCVSCQTQAQVG